MREPERSIRVRTLHPSRSATSSHC
jgi:hypothetical protein